MTNLFSDGFESGNLSNWTSTTTAGTGTIAVDASLPHSPVYDAHVKLLASGDKAYVTKNIASSPIAYFRFYAYFNQLNIVSPNLLYIGGISESTNSYRFILWVTNQSGVYKWQIQVYEAGVSIGSAYGTHAPVAGQYYCVELERDVTNGFQKLWINGTLEASLSKTITTNANQVLIGTYYDSTAGTNELFYDDVAVSDSYIGPMAISVALTDALGLNDSTLRDKIALIIVDNVNSLDDSFKPKVLLQVSDSTSLQEDALVSRVLGVYDDVALVEIVEREVRHKTRLFLVLGDLAIQLTGD